jgi:PX domain
MDAYIILHSTFLAWGTYFFGYSVQRIVRHWRDGRERVRTSKGRLILKIACTFLCAIFQFLHIADYLPGKYSDAHLALRIVYYTISGISWLFSSVLVYFDYTRRLKAQWRGQRTFWLLGLAITLSLLVLSILTDSYKDTEAGSYQFDIIQITAYTLTIPITILLSFYSIFRPNDFAVISNEMYLKLKRPSLLFDDTTNKSLENKITLDINITGYKIKQVLNTSVINYNINVAVNDTTYGISRSLADFEALDRAMRKTFSINCFPNLTFPDFNLEVLRKMNAVERGDLLCKYLKALCFSEFMTPDLLNFLQIEGNYRDLLSCKHNLMQEELIQNSDIAPRAESSSLTYYSPISHTVSVLSYLPSSILQWMISSNIAFYRYNEESQLFDYYLKTEISSLGHEKLKPYKFKDFLNFHKTLKKILSPCIPASFPSKNYNRSFLQKDKNAIEVRKTQLEYYFSQILNDPAYLCKETLDFIGCDAVLAQILDLIPPSTYKLAEEISWESDISDDSAHYILYSFTIGKISKDSKCEVQWKVSKRYKEFDALHKKLLQRYNSPYLKSYLLHIGKYQKDNQLPLLPSKTLSPLSTLNEIEERKRLLQIYMQELLNSPSVTCSFAFREFIDDRDI